MKKSIKQNELTRILNNTLTAFTKPFSTEDLTQSSSNTQRTFNAPLRKDTNPFLDQISYNSVNIIK
jgi:hypothetical protein